jgi:hypothetical protein
MEPAGQLNKSKIKMISRILVLICIIVYCRYLPAQDFNSYTNKSFNGDYSKEECWAALPWKNDYADLLPDTSLKNRQDTAQADVFFIHPTTYVGLEWNADISNDLLNKTTDKGTIKMQASVFNGSCRVFAPYYRQAVMRTFFSPESEKSKEVLDFAYSDVKKAFIHYLKNWNENRPFIIASHSQGSRHAIELIKELIDTTSLKKNLVAAYIIGWPLKCDEFQNIPVCSNQKQNECFVTWNSFDWGTEKTIKNYFENACCVNPLTWTADSTFGGREMHKGSVPLTFKRIDKNTVDARCVNGKLWVQGPKGAEYFLVGKNYHVMDYDLFYLDIRMNIAERINNHINKNQYR